MRPPPPQLGPLRKPARAWGGLSSLSRGRLFPPAPAMTTLQCLQICQAIRRPPGGPGGASSQPSGAVLGPPFTPAACFPPKCSCFPRGLIEAP